VYEEIDEIINSAKTVAMVGVSAKHEADSNLVARYLTIHGYDIIPINPTVDEILGRKAHASLRDLEQPPDVVQVFRKPEAVPGIVEDAIAIGAKVVWMQLGIVNEEAAARAREAGLTVVMDHCMKREHERINGIPPDQEW
jgi:predicted CoA-binding protein